MRVIDITLKDLTQIVRDWRAATFLLAMPIAFTLDVRVHVRGIFSRRN